MLDIKNNLLNKHFKEIKHPPSGTELNFQCSSFLTKPTSPSFCLNDKKSEYEEKLKMPLIFFPKKSFNENLWNGIATDILRSIHSEHSFAKNSDFGLKKKNLIKFSQATDKITTESTKTQLFSPKNNILSPFEKCTFFIILPNDKKNKIDDNIKPLEIIDTFSHIPFENKKYKKNNMNIVKNSPMSPLKIGN